MVISEQTIRAAFNTTNNNIIWSTTMHKVHVGLEKDSRLGCSSWGFRLWNNGSTLRYLAAYDPIMSPGLFLPHHVTFFNCNPFRDLSQSAGKSGTRRFQHLHPLLSPGGRERRGRAQWIRLVSTFSTSAEWVRAEKIRENKTPDCDRAEKHV